MSRALRNPDGTLTLLFETTVAGAGLPPITLRWGALNGRPEPFTVEIGARFDDPTEKDPVPITATLLRQIPLRRLAERGRVQKVPDQTRMLREVLGYHPPAPPDLEEPDRRSRAVGRPPYYAVGHFEDVARVYKVAYWTGAEPRQAVVEAWGVAPSTAAKWIHRARYEFGLLPPTTRGRAAAPRPDEPSE